MYLLVALAALALPLALVQLVHSFEFLSVALPPHPSPLSLSLTAPLLSCPPPSLLLSRVWFLCFGMHRIDGLNFMLLTDVFLLWHHLGYPYSPSPCGIHLSFTLRLSLSTGCRILLVRLPRQHSMQAENVQTVKCQKAKCECHRELCEGTRSHDHGQVHTRRWRWSRRGC